MVRERAQRSVDARIAALAARQYGVVTRRQLVALGVSGAAIEARVRRGRLHPLHRGVYAVGHPVVGIDGRRLAAAWSCGPHAVLSHRSAAGLWGLRADASARFDVTVPTRAGRRPRRGIVVHRMAVRPFEVTARDGIPVTTPARTLVDLAEVVGRRPLERAADEAQGLRLFDLVAIERVLDAHPGRHGSARVGALLAGYGIGAGLTRSELEERVLAVCDRAGVPRPAVNARVAGLEVDFLWAAERLVLEADSRRHHDTRAAFERDRERDARLLVAGLRVLRVTRGRLVLEPDEVGATLLALLRTPTTAAR